jgi:teichoic acid transport system ATP-binding protein
MTEIADRAEGSPNEPGTPDTAPRHTIEVDDVHVRYEVVARRQRTLLSRLSRSGVREENTRVRALSGVNLQTSEGDALAVIGPNGAGKSTLLAAIAGLLPVTSGQVRVSSEPQLFGVGAKLLPFASGERNIRLGATALGIDKDDLDDVCRDIADFSGLAREALQRPLRTYSSGMRARVHFSIATCVQPKILLVDEALAVGDRTFRRRAEERIETILDGAGTLILVSHNTREVRRSTRGRGRRRGAVGALRVRRGLRRCRGHHRRTTRPAVFTTRE